MWLKLLAGTAVVFALFHGLAHALGSDRGQAGLLIAGAVVATLVQSSGRRSGKRRPVARSLGFG